MSASRGAAGADDDDDGLIIMAAAAPFCPRAFDITSTRDSRGVVRGKENVPLSQGRPNVFTKHISPVIHK
jgi:hypothetical protein